MSAEIRKCALLVEDSKVNIMLFETHFKKACPSWELIVVQDAINAANAIIPLVIQESSFRRD